MALTKTHNRMTEGSVLNVLDFGATGDGSTVDTTAIQTTITNASSGDTIYFPSGNYVMGAVQVTKALHFFGNATITLTGSAAGFELQANMSNLSFKDLTFVGDADIANTHRAIWNDSTRTISNVLVQNLTVTSCVQSIDLATITDFVVDSCTISSAAGTAAGDGYGLVFGTGIRARVTNNTFVDNGRHSIYTRSGKDVVISGNSFLDHANTSGGGLYPINIIGVQNLVISNNTFRDTASVFDISIDDDTDGSTVCENVTISDNVFFGKTSGDYGGIDIGASSVTGTEFVRNINITNNVFNASPAKDDGIIQVTNGRQVRIAGNTFQQTAGTATNYQAILLSAGAGDSNFNEIIIENNTGRFAKTSGNSEFVKVGSALCTGVCNIFIYQNNIKLNDQDYLIVYATAPTNANIKTDWDYEKAFTLASGSQTISGAGYNNFVITGDAGASTLTNITNTYSGKEVTLRFVDANTTFTRNNAYLAGGANFTSTDKDILKLLNRGGAWYETTRSANS